MTFDTLLTLLVLVAVSLFTPGPNNALLANSGATFGLRRSWPHILGVAMGFPLMIMLVGFFLGEAFQSSALLRETLRWLGAAIMLWLAWKIASSGGMSGTGAKARPFTFLQAVAFQWVNPKGWALCIGITAQFLRPEAPVSSALIIGAACLAVGLCSATTWALIGRAITRWLTEAHHLRRFNIAMAAIIVICVGLLFAG
ncbi:MAG: LysE family translocator [Tropicimonas sp.]|uniref:LysE family translocator n=1 Tax=Tropicimonas sp. TaxID=2067044 RepID=UPI003A83F69D